MFAAGMVHSSSHTGPTQRAIKKFRSNPMAMVGFFFVLFVILISLLGPWIRPDNTQNANRQNLSISGQKPGFSVDMIRVKNNLVPTSALQAWLDGGYVSNYEEISVAQATVQGDTVVVYTYEGQGRPSKKRSWPTMALVQNEVGGYTFHQTFVLGTDKYGRDLLSRLLAGTVISLAVGAISVFISLLVGLTVGLMAGYFRGWTDKVLMWFTNVIWAVPTLLLVMAITFAFGTGFWKVFLAVGLTMWVEVARIARGQVLSIREKEFVEAARALGFSEMRIVFKHILPSILSPIIVISAANFASAILIEAGLSFLGLGAQIPTPSWGNMIREHYAFITTDMAYLAILPGILIMALVLAFMLVGNGLRDALDVRD
jgi:peptide/nickel transport system permease protein